MARGWAREGAEQDEMDAGLQDAVERARSRLPVGESLAKCEQCNAVIPVGRRKAIPGVRLCVKCQSGLEKQ